uniref:PLD phosphodiesterase domain-containing protein n=1 Tax=Parascaris equorum TaxID=6256 RepID=A0A914RRC5_PAREQ
NCRDESWKAVDCVGGPGQTPSTEVGHWWGRAGFLAGTTLTICTGNYVTDQLEVNQLRIDSEPYRWEKLVPRSGAEFTFPLVKHQIVVYDNKVFVFGGSVNVSRIGGALFHNGDSVDLLDAVLRLDLKEKSWNAFSTLKGCCKPVTSVPCSEFGCHFSGLCTQILSASPRTRLTLRDTCFQRAEVEVGQFTRRSSESGSYELFTMQQSSMPFYGVFRAHVGLLRRSEVLVTKYVALNVLHVVGVEAFGEVKCWFT